jgi:hypothetical protein
MGCIRHTIQARINAQQKNTTAIRGGQQHRGRRTTDYPSRLWRTCLPRSRMPDLLQVGRRRTRATTFPIAASNGCGVTNLSFSALLVSRRTTRSDTERVRCGGATSFSAMLPPPQTEQHRGRAVGIFRQIIIFFFKDSKRERPLCPTSPVLNEWGNRDRVCANIRDDMARSKKWPFANYKTDICLIGKVN